MCFINHLQQGKSWPTIHLSYEHWYRTVDFTILAINTLSQTFIYLLIVISLAALLALSSTWPFSAPYLWVLSGTPLIPCVQLPSPISPQCLFLVDLRACCQTHFHLSIHCPVSCHQFMSNKVSPQKKQEDMKINLLHNSLLCRPIRKVVLAVTTNRPYCSS